MAVSGNIILGEMIKAITALQTIHRTLCILDGPRLGLFKRASLTRRPSKPTVRPPFTRHVRLAPSTVQAFFQVRTALIVVFNVIVVISLHVVVITLAVFFAIQYNLPWSLQGRHLYRTDR